MKFFNDAKLRAGSLLREWKERREEDKAQKQAAAAVNSEHGHGRFFLLTVPATATICAAVVEWYWALLFCIEATGRIDWNYETAFGNEGAASSIWNFAFSAHWPVLVGLVAATVPIVMLSMVWLPVQFAMRGSGRWRRGSVILCGLLANVLVIVSGTVVMNYNRQDQVREALVVEQTADAQRTMLVASVDDLRAELDTLMNHRSTYVATAASVGAAAYERDYVAQARATNDPRLPLIERALGSARRADELRASIAEARRAVATAAPAAAVQANVEDTVGRELNTFAQYVEVWRPPFVAVICTLIGIFGAWWTIALMQGLNPRDVLRSGWADEGHRIEDLRHEEPIAREPMKPAREAVFDADSGEELVPVRATWRKKPKKKGERGQMETATDAPLTERNTSTDGGNRTAVTLGGAMEVESAATVIENTGQNEAEPKADADERTNLSGENEAHEPYDRDREKAEQETIGASHPETSDPILSQQDDADVENLLAEESEAALPIEQASDTTVEPASMIDADPEQVSEGSDGREVGEDTEGDDHTEEPREPLTDPSRLIAAE